MSILWFDSDASENVTTLEYGTGFKEKIGLRLQEKCVSDVVFPAASE